MSDPEARCQVYITVLKHITSLDVDWKAFAEELGISLAGNAQRKFKECLKKDGFQLAAGEITPLDENSTPKAAAPSKRKKSEIKNEKTPKKTKKAATKKEEDDTEELKVEDEEKSDVEAE